MTGTTAARFLEVLHMGMRYGAVHGVELEAGELVQLAALARAGSFEARDRLVLGHVRVAVAVVEKMLCGLQLEYDWALREEMLAASLALLVEVAGRWDPAVSTFPNFAMPYLHRACVETLAGRHGLTPYWRRVLEERGTPAEEFVELDAPVREGEVPPDPPDPLRGDPESLLLAEELEELTRLAEAFEPGDVGPALECLGWTRRELAARAGFAPDDFRRWEQRGVQLDGRQRFAVLAELWPAARVTLQQRSGVNWPGDGNPFAETLRVRPELVRRRGRARRRAWAVRCKRSPGSVSPVLREVLEALPVALRELRVQRNVSQRQLAERWGVATCTVGLWESGYRAVPVRRLPPVLTWCAGVRA